MNWMRKLTGLLRRGAIEAELEEEMRTHLEMKAAASGDRRAAHRQFGNPALLLEDSRAVWGWPRAEAWAQDFRYAVRGLIRHPVFAATVAATLALGIGASSTIFSLIDTVLLRPLPYPEPDRLVAIHEAKPADQYSTTPVAPGRLEDWRRLSHGFEAIAGSHVDPLIDETGTVPQRLSAAFVSPGFFSVFGVQPAIGRVLTEQEENFGGPLTIVISDSFWRRRFGADPAAIGRSLILTGRAYVIVGVMPPSFQYPSAAVSVWAPKQAASSLLALREARFYQCVARLKRGVTPEQAQAELRSVQTMLGSEYPKTDAGWSIVIVPLKEELVGEVRLALWLLFGSVSLLLVIACANVACLLLARLNSRSTEIATRCALGARRTAIARQLFAEGLVYALLGGLLGLGALFAGIDLLHRQLSEIPRIAELAPDARVIALVTGVSFLATLLFSIAPMLQVSRRDAAASALRGGRTVIGARNRLSRLLVTTQLALATALLIGAGLFLRSLIRVQNVPLGLEPQEVLTFRVTGSYGETPAATIQRHQRTMEAFSALPGVISVAMSSGLPGVSPTWPREFAIAGEATPDGTLRFARWRIVTADYFQTVRIPILAGESCRMTPDPERPFEVLINRSFAGRYFPGRDPIGHTIEGGPMGDTAARVTGVVANSREDGPGTEPQPLVYACGFLRYWPDSEFLIRTRDPEAIAGAVRAALRELEPSRPIYAMQPLTEALREALSRTRIRAVLVSLFSILALTLSAIGLYGVMAYMVSQRRREIGIRMALGARPMQVAGEILRSGAALAGQGAIAGIVLAVAASRMVSALLYGVRASDLISYLSAIGVLFLVTMVACLIPSRRALSIYPAEVLREQ